MPWTKKDYPVSMKNLPEAVRGKAIEIANALLEERDMGEGIAIATAISRAKDWAVEHNKSIKPIRKSRTTEVKKHGEDRYVIPYENEWAIKVEGEEEVEKVFHLKKEAVQEARKEAEKFNGTLTIQRKTGQVEKKISFNPLNTGNRKKGKKKRASI
jgi:uncharacterized protein YdaT